MARKKQPDELIDFATDMEEPELIDAMRSLRKDRNSPAAVPLAAPAAPKPGRRSPKSPASPTKQPAPHIDIHNNKDYRE